MDIAPTKFPAAGTSWSVFTSFCRDFLQESRVSVQVIFLIRFGTAAALGTTIFGGREMAAALAWVLATLAAYVFNGVMDVTEDRANGSTRPISRGSLPVPVAAGGVVVSSGLALTIGGIVDPGGLLPLLILAHLVCGYAYSGAPFYGKRRGYSAVLLVLAMGVLTYAAGWQVADRKGGIAILLLGAAMSLWMGGVGALAKDLPDAEGDAAGGRRTPVIVWGDRRVRILITVNAVVIAFGYLAATVAFAPVLVPSAIALVFGAVAVGSLAATTRTATTRSGRRLPYRAFMVTQYAVHIVVLAALLF
ncbi:UbiA family prenyltransferase [Antrihabitans cavernicola]